ncbi:transporter [Vibrio sp. 10N.286.49.B3]|uniref:AEC family transporter n=1 Tax=Vibrio sp. 10N.286.49.B3 TaxID=1880855 RepID=UPI000C81F7EE|nr:AEC family transporter [Vibrio sp. 10N.286.49.B3]PMH43137.1 transporter [Vibrio sp. 10N.286.49.B3]
MAHLLDQLLFSISITGPICIMLLLGVILKRVGIINENFIDVASKIVFQITLPAMLFLSIINSEHDFAASGTLLIYGLIANILFYLFTTLSTHIFFKKPEDKGVIIQGGFRSNTAIIALAYVANVYGDEGVALAAIYVAACTLLYNILAVIALSPKGEESSSKALGVITKTLTKNPLIIAIFLGMLFYFLSIPVPKVITDAGQYFANMTLPLALLCTGGALNIGSLREETFSTFFSTGYKLVLCPLLITLGAYCIGFTELDLGLVFFMSAAPTAAASYIMARAMGGNAVLAANIIALTTVLSLVTCTMGIFILSTFNLL